MRCSSRHGSVAGPPPLATLCLQSAELSTGTEMTTKHCTVAGLHYLLRTPTAPAPSPAGHPLLLFLHGRGESGPADGSELALAAFHGPLKVIEKGPDGPGLPAEVLKQFIIVNPQCQDAPDSWAPHIADLRALLAEVSAMRALTVDPAHLYLTGVSMGGVGTWALAAAYPELFAAIVPICGGECLQLRYCTRSDVLEKSHLHDPWEQVRCSTRRATSRR
jgi:predicted peptidase